MRSSEVFAELTKQQNLSEGIPQENEAEPGFGENNELAAMLAL